MDIILAILVVIIVVLGRKALKTIESADNRSKELADELKGIIRDFNNATLEDNASDEAKILTEKFYDNRKDSIK